MWWKRNNTEEIYSILWSSINLNERATRQQELCNEKRCLCEIQLTFYVPSSPNLLFSYNEMYSSQFNVVYCGCHFYNGLVYILSSLSSLSSSSLSSSSFVVSHTHVLRLKRLHGIEMLIEERSHRMVVREWAFIIHLCHIIHPICAYSIALHCIALLARFLQHEVQRLNNSTE